MNHPLRIASLLVLVFINLSAFATDWYVNDASVTGDVFTTAIGDNTNPGTAAAPFATVQFAISSASAGDVIYVDAGTYASANITINKALTIRGAKYGIHAGPMDTPPGRGTDETIINAGIYILAATDNVSIDGLTIDIGAGLRGIEARGLNTVIINNIVTGILLPFNQQQGIATRANAPVRTHSYNIAYNNVKDLRFGIYMDGALENTSVIEYNFVSGCFTAGYHFTASNGHIIRYNVSDNNSQGMVFTKGNNTIMGNTIMNNTAIGIRMAGSSQLSANNITNNYLTDNNIAIGLTDPNAGAFDNHANYNSITGNNLAVSSTHTASFDAQCNWYGTVDPAAIAALMTGTVVYNPFLPDGTDGDLAEDGFQPPISSCTVIPVILTAFNATAKDQQVLLKWQTASEINSSHFVIQRSIDEIHFENIGTVQAKGFSDVLTNYTFTDARPVQFDRPVFYRLAMVDRNGSTKYSSIRSVTLSLSESFVQAFPNPVKAGGILQVRFSSAEKQLTHITLNDAAGRIIQQSELNAVKGLNTITQKAPPIAGIHYLIIRNADGVKRIPVFVY